MSESSIELLKFLGCCIAMVILAIPTIEFTSALSARLFEFIYDKVDDWLSRFE